MQKSIANVSYERIKKLVRIEECLHSQTENATLSKSERSLYYKTLGENYKK